MADRGMMLCPATRHAAGIAGAAPEHPPCSAPRLPSAGTMGGACADTLLKLGYPVSAWTRTPRQRPGVRCFHGAEQLPEFAAGVDVLVCLLPLTDATRWVRWVGCGGCGVGRMAELQRCLFAPTLIAHAWVSIRCCRHRRRCPACCRGILNAQLFAWLPAGASVINAARGGHLVDADLLAALDSGHVRAQPCWLVTAVCHWRLPLPAVAEHLLACTALPIPLPPLPACQPCSCPLPSSTCFHPSPCQRPLPCGSTQLCASSHMSAA